MINEEMINSVKNTLNFLEDLSSKSDDELREIIKKNNLEGKHYERKEMIETIFKHFITGRDLAFYRKYLDYTRMRKAELMGSALDDLSNLTSQVDKCYAIRKEAMGRKVRALDNVSKLNKSMIGVPFIRVSIAFSHVENRKSNYISLRTKDGMKRANIADEISDVKSRGVIVRAISARKVKRLQEQLQEHNKLSVPNVKKAYEEYTDEVKSYCDTLRQLFYDLLEDKVVRRGAYLSYKLVSQLGVNYEEEDLGLKEPTVEELKDLDKESIYLAFVKFANFPSADELDSKLFQTKLEEFIAYYDQTIANRAELKVSTMNGEVAILFNHQKAIVSDLMTSRDSYLRSNDFTEDEEDTYSLVYTGLDGGSKK